MKILFIQAASVCVRLLKIVGDPVNLQKEANILGFTHEQATEIVVDLEGTHALEPLGDLPRQRANKTVVPAVELFLVLDKRYERVVLNETHAKRHLEHPQRLG